LKDLKVKNEFLPGILSGQMETFCPAWPIPAAIKRKADLAKMDVANVRKRRAKNVQSLRSCRQLMYKVPLKGRIRKK
jgi:hypothetical protein